MRIKIISVVLIVIVVAFGLISNNLEYSLGLLDGGLVIKEYRSSDDHVVIPSKIFNIDIISIDAYAFNNKDIKSVYIPSSVKYIGPFVFSNNPGLKIDVSEDNPYFKSVNGILYNKDETILIAGSHNDIGSGVHMIRDGAFEGMGLSEIDLPNNLTHIKDGAFRNNNIVNLELPKSLQVIDKDAFRSNLVESIVFSENIKIIRDGAFRNNPIRQIIGSELVERIDEGAF